jgi:type II secretory pathway pseudopilin PulG
VSLLESIVALVILGLAAVGFLELFQRVTTNTRDQRAWIHAAQVAELTMEQVLAGDRLAGDDTVGTLRRRVRVQPWRGAVREIVVDVELPPPGAAHVELRRLSVTR